MLYTHLKDWKAVIANCNHLIEKWPQIADFTLINRAFAKEQLGDIPGAIRDRQESERIAGERTTNERRIQLSKAKDVEF